MRKLLVSATVLLGLGATIAPAHAAVGQVHLYHNSYHSNYIGSELTANLASCMNMPSGDEVKSAHNGSAWKIRFYNGDGCTGDYQAVPPYGVMYSAPFWADSLVRVAP